MGYLKNKLSDNAKCLHVVWHLWKLQIDPAILVGYRQVCLAMTEVHLMNKLISQLRVEWLH